MSNHAVIVLHVPEVEEYNGNVLSVFAKRITVLIEDEFLKTLIGRYQVVRLDCLYCTPETINHLLGIAGSDVRIQSKESIFEPFTHENILGVTRNAVGRDIFPANILRCCNQHLLDSIVFCKHIVCILIQILRFKTTKF